jgi:hypothetical protein
VTPISEQEESKVYNLEDFQSQNNNNFTPIEQHLLNDNQNQLYAAPTVIDQRRLGMNISQDDAAGELIVEQRATSYFIQKSYIDESTGQERIILEPLVQEEHKKPLSAAPRSQEALSQGAVLQDSNKGSLSGAGGGASAHQLGKQHPITVLSHEAHSEH